jgi:serine/threonine-protein kinase
VLLSAYGSTIIYGLQQKVTEVQQLGQYRRGRLLGEGGNGKVYLAHHMLLRRPTAIKLVPAAKVGVGSLERFEREVQHMSQLTHPNSVAVYDYGHSDGVFYYAMEYLGGGINLQDLVTHHNKQPAERVRRILIQVCSALQEAHERKLIHRDVKPANIILCERGAMPDFVKVVDYGLVKELAADSGQSTQIVLGTPAYIAPEAFTDPSSIGPGVDLYALGAVGYFLLTGRRVFTGATDLDTCIQHVTKEPTRPSEHGVEVPKGLEDILMQCLAKKPADRYPSADALAEALTALGSLGDWSDEQAAAWWEKHRRSEVPAEISEQPTATITINITERGAVADRLAEEAA